MQRNPKETISNENKLKAKHLEHTKKKIMTQNKSNNINKKKGENIMAKTIIKQ